MSVELQAAYAKVGGAEAICDECRPTHANSLPRLGLHSRESSGTQNNFNVRTRLDHVVRYHTRCWICCWLLLLVAGRRMESLHKTCRADHDKVWLGFGPHKLRTFEKGKTSADTYHDTRELSRMAAWMDTRELGGEFDYFIYFQTSDQNPLGLSPLLDQTELLDWPNYLPFTTRIRPVHVDMRLLQRWKQKCLDSHTEDCEPTRVSLVQGIRVIDVQDRCIVELKTNIPWITLSYCWGGPQQHALVTSNFSHYHELSALTDSILPPVILDAMTVTKCMGERYLWVDSLCIIQDDEVDKVRFLSSMDAIYAHAIFTIINAAGSNVNSPAGLPGMRRTSPRRPHIAFNLNGTWLSEALDPGHGYYSGYVENTTWHSRGWTFQEALLSRRCLIFTEDQVYWHCQKSSWCEGSFWERDDDLQIYRHFLGDNLLTSVLEPPGTGVDKDWNQVYTAIMTKYLTRTFTSESDRLHALTGILRVLGKAAGDSFHWGLPITTIEHYLAFATTTQQHGSHRRTTPHKTIDLANKNLLNSSPFPSWSWTGWQGQMGQVTTSVTIGTLGLKFYRLESTPLSLINTLEVKPIPLLHFHEETQSATSNTTKVYDDTDPRSKIQYPPDAKHDKWMPDTNEQEITTATIPEQLMSSKYKNLLPSILCFYTSVARLRITDRAWSNYHRQFRVVLEDEYSNNNNKTHGLFGGDTNIDLPELGVFIVVGAKRLRMSHGGDLTLNLLMLEPFQNEHLKEGLADERVDALALEGVVWRRKYLVTEVKEKEWEKLECRRWEVVYLA